jgi:hypothetical protein
MESALQLANSRPSLSGGTTLKLRDCGIYQFQGAPDSPYQGQSFLVRQFADEYGLYSVEELTQKQVIPGLMVDSRGRILFKGLPIGYTAEMLVDTGLSARERRS